MGKNYGEKIEAASPPDPIFFSNEIEIYSGEQKIVHAQRTYRLYGVLDKS